MSKTRADFERALAELRGQPASDIGSALAEIRGGETPRVPGHDSGLILRRNERGRQNDMEAAEADEIDRSNPSFAQKALGGVASLAREIPGAEFLQAGARSLVRGQSYGDALEDIRGAEDALPLAAKIALRAPGAIASTAVLPGSNLAKGAIYGALSGYTDADPEADRSTGTVTGGLIGGALGAGADAATAGARGIGRLVRRQAGRESQAARAMVNTVRQRLTRNRPAPANLPVGPLASPRVQTQSAISTALQPQPVAPAPAAPMAAPSSAPTPASALRLMPSAVPSPPATPVAPTVTPGPRAAAVTSIDDQITALLDRLRTAQPSETGNVWGDAEIAQGLHLPEPDLESLLRQSLLAKPRLVKAP